MKIIPQQNHMVSFCETKPKKNAVFLLTFVEYLERSGDDECIHYLIRSPYFTSVYVNFYFRTRFRRRKKTDGFLSISFPKRKEKYPVDN